MEQDSNKITAKIALNDKEFERLSVFIYSNFGIKLPPAKKIMLESRLQKRLKINGFSTFSAYLEYLFKEEGNDEIIHMIDQVSTNKTDFFREPVHFEFLSKVILPEYKASGSREILKIWSAAASTGEEIYTIAMVLEEFNKASVSAPLIYSILGTDISVQTLKKALNAVYDLDRIKMIPYEMKKRYFLKSKDKSKPTARIKPEIRNKVRFKRLNLMDNGYNVDENYDIIFCRNVLIYFDKETQEKVVQKLCERLKIGGYFFLGHSESILGKNVPLQQLQPTIYRRI